MSQIAVSPWPSSANCREVATNSELQRGVLETHALIMRHKGLAGFVVVGHRNLSSSV